MVNWNKDYQIHTILFNKHINKIEDAVKWLLDNDYKLRKIHETTNEYRFRQISPETLKKHGFNIYRTKMIDPKREIQLVIAYKDPVETQKKILGGAIPLNKPLYEMAKNIVYSQYEKPSAYRSGALVKKYKELGGKYKDDNDERKLKRWFDEKWVDVGNSTYPVYRPTIKISKDTPLIVSEIDPKNLKQQIKRKQIIKGDFNLKPFQKK